VGTVPVEGDEQLSVTTIDPSPGPVSERIALTDIAGGWSTRSYPHLLKSNQLVVADNVVYYRDGLVSKRPGNAVYGNGTGKIGTGTPVLDMTRFYKGTPPTGTLVAHSGTGLYSGNDVTGAFTAINAGMSASARATYAQMYDPDFNAGAGGTALFVADGNRIPQTWDGATFVAVQTGGVYLPNGRTGAPITPAFVADWNHVLCYAGEPTEPQALYISDALRPERFTGFSFIDSAASSYIPYFPGGRDSTLGPITGIRALGAHLVIFYHSGIVIGINTGSYGAFQYQFGRISSSVGCKSPRSIVAFDTFLAFHGGDKFYATDAQSLYPLPDELPTLYANNSRSVQPPEIKNNATVVGVRRGSQYWASYDSTGSGLSDKIAVFDLAANNGWQYGQQEGGAWARWPSGMRLNCGLECRGPGDTFQVYWGSSADDTVYQHDVGTYDDAGAPISVEVRAKSFFLGRPLGSKSVLSLYCMMVYDLRAGAYVSTLQPYVWYDAQQDVAPTSSVNVMNPGVLFGTRIFGTFTFQPTVTSIQLSPKAFPSNQGPGLSISPGVSESSGNSFNIIGFVMEVVTDPNPPGG